MDFVEYKKNVTQIKVGKKLPTAIYVHDSALDSIPKKLLNHIANTIEELSLSNIEWNLIKFHKNDHKISLLYYPSFDEYSYPPLSQSITIDIENKSTTTSNYSNSENPPILHRKETFVKKNHPLIGLFTEITTEGENIGLYEKTRSIGFKQNWERLIKSKAHYLDEHGRLKALIIKPTNKHLSKNFNGQVERHKTAINRHQLSKPMSILAKHEYLNGEYSIFDYGCGKGDDVRELEAHGLNVSKYDPHHYPDESKIISDIVNLGFVLNVIEDRNERDKTLQDAWILSKKLLIVSVMIAGESTLQKFTPYKDGVITKTNTFQKYYAQSEMRYYIETILNEQAIPVGQGVFLIFKDKIEEQNFLVKRQYINRDWQQKTIREIQSNPVKIKKSIFEKHIELFSHYWETTLKLGRIPTNNEFEYSDQIRRIVGSHLKAHKFLINIFGENIFNESVEKRRNDLLVYFALGLFEKRRPQTHMPESLKRDIKAFFNTYTSAIESAKNILFSLSNTNVIQEACTNAYNILKCGLMEEGHSYTFHKKYIGDLPPELRIYIGCATQLYGDLEDIHLIKSHITSGKVSLMGYDDWNKKEPLLLERIKIKLREQDVDFFDYIGRYKPTPLLNKEKFLN